MIYPQLLIFFGLLMTAIGGFWAWKVSDQEDKQKELSHLVRTEQTDSLIKKGNNSILSNQDTAFSKIHKELESTKKTIKSMPKGKGDMIIKGDNNHVVQGDNNGINGDVNFNTEPQLSQQDKDQILKLIHDYEMQNNIKFVAFNIVIEVNSKSRTYAEQLNDFLVGKGYTNMVAGNGFTSIYGLTEKFSIEPAGNWFKVYLNL